jgi:hypothetical protein
MSQKTPYIKGTLQSKLRFTLELNNTKTVLNQTSLGGVLCWSGKPFSVARGISCPVALVIGADGTIPYGPALNFIVDAGASRAGTQRPAEKLEETRKLLLLAWQYHVAEACTDAVRRQDTELLGADLGQWLSGHGFSLVDGESTEGDRYVYGLLGVSQDIVCLAEHHGWSLVPDFSEIVAKRVPRNFARVCEGDWDAASATIAATNNLTSGEVAAMQYRGLRFARCGERRAVG